jgi:hypothetical protein
MKITTKLFLHGVNTTIDAQLVLPDKYKDLPITVVLSPVLECNSDDIIYNKFIAECILQKYNKFGDRDKKCYRRIFTIYKEFKYWVNKSFPGYKIPCESDFSNKLSEKLHHPGGDIWHGIQLISKCKN